MPSDESVERDDQDLAQILAKVEHRLDLAKDAAIEGKKPTCDSHLLNMYEDLEAYLTDGELDE